MLVCLPPLTLSDAFIALTSPTLLLCCRLRTHNQSIRQWKFVRDCIVQSICITHAATIELVQRRANIAKVDVQARDKNVFYHN